MPGCCKSDQLSPQRVEADQDSAGLSGGTDQDLHHRHRVPLLVQPGGTVRPVGPASCNLLPLSHHACLASSHTGDSEHPGVRQQGQAHPEQAGGEPEAHQEDAHQGGSAAAAAA